MKKRFIISIICLPYFGLSQVAIGKNTISSNAVSLEFGNENRGLLLPWVTSVDQVMNAVNGTLVYDTSDKKVYIKKAIGWSDLTIDGTGVVDTKLQDSLSDFSNSRVVIGGDPQKDTTPGILVLADSDKAMILPKVTSPHLNIANPSPGMIVYDKYKKMLAVFNGNVWSFWKASN